MKIGLFTDAYKPAVSGVVTSVLALKEGLEALGHEVCVITTKPVKVKLIETEVGVIRYRGFRIPKKGLDIYRFATSLRKKEKELEKQHFDVIHVHTEFSIGKLGRMLAKKKNIPMVYTFHTMYEDYFHFVSRLLAKTAKKPMLKVLKKLIANYCNVAKAIILPTEKVHEVFKQYGFGNYPIHIIPTGIDIEHFYRENVDSKRVLQIKEELKINKDDFVFMFLGRVSAEKSIDVVIKEFSKLALNNKTKLLIVGGGPYEKTLHELVSKLKLERQVIFTGMVDWVDVPLYYQIGDVFVNPSKTETQGLTYAEALASGLPVIVNDDLAIKAYIHHGYNGMLAKNDDEIGLYMKDLLENRAKRDELAMNAKASVEDFSVKKYSERILAVYEQIVKENK